jgi:hypothetical protein
MSNINEQQVVEEVVMEVVETVKGKGKATKKQTGSTSSNDDVASLKLLVEQLTKRVDELESRLSELEGKPTEPQTKPKVVKNNEEKKPRAPTAYNLFMKEKMTELKESHPTLTNIERMKMAAEAWSESKK